MAYIFKDLQHTAAQIDQSIDDLASHIANGVIHITAAEREAWNAKATTADVTAEAEARQQADGELQTAINSKAPSADLTAETTARTNADAKQVAALAELINSGAKNLLTESNGSGVANVTINAEVPAGEYVVSFGSLTSTDTDKTTCQVIALQGNTVVSASPQLQMERGNNVHGTMIVSSAANRIQIYASRTGGEASGDTVTFTNAMLCTKAAYEISQDYVPYRPTWDQMWDMIKALQT